MRSAFLAFVCFLAGSLSAVVLASQPPQIIVQEISPPCYRAAGEWIYLHAPDALLESVGKAEGVPSFGILALASRYGGHRFVPKEQGRRTATWLVRRFYARWILRGRPGDFLVFLRDVYAPLGASNDHGGLNAYWLSNVLRYVPDSVLAEVVRQVYR